jgi:hypothetical protein
MSYNRLQVAIDVQTVRAEIDGCFIVRKAPS